LCNKIVIVRKSPETHVLKAWCQPMVLLGDVATLRKWGQLEGHWSHTLEGDMWLLFLLFSLLIPSCCDVISFDLPWSSCHDGWPQHRIKVTVRSVHGLELWNPEPKEIFSLLKLCIIRYFVTALESWLSQWHNDYKCMWSKVRLPCLIVLSL
jgi:hypothetical protein